ncbi:hypothetical protein NQ318_014657 [Aromia moschata]|uniref:Uncharacterized protein n=1 Tax=Aromia moschata TaxID=1265417 RepID=A0AAV8ZE02_9CUCU|nr:hypothetical protein NQ318_014657 [Aromia moschata]
MSEPAIDWTTPAKAYLLKSKHYFHQHMMQATLHLIQNVKRHKEIDGRYKKLYYEYVSDIASILFHRIIKRLSDFIDFDYVTANLAVDCFHAILDLMNRMYKIGKDIEDNFISQLRTVVDVYKKIFEMNEEEIVDAPEIKRMYTTVVNTLSILGNQIPADSNPLSVQLCEWLKNFSYNNTVPGKASGVFVNHFFEMHIKYKVSLNIFEDISVTIGDIIGVITDEEHNVEKFAIVNEESVHTILQSVCTHIKSILEDIDAVIARLKSEYNILMYPGAENVEKRMDNLKIKERGNMLPNMSYCNYNDKFKQFSNSSWKYN